MPKLRRQTFEMAMIKRYRCRDTSIDEGIVQMCLAGVSVGRVGDITEALWGTRVSSGEVSNLNEKVYRHIERLRTQRIEGEVVYVYLDGIVLERSWGAKIKNVSILVAIGVDSSGYRRVLGAAKGHKADRARWLGFLEQLKSRGLDGVRLIVIRCLPGVGRGLRGGVSEAAWRRCAVHFYRNVFSHVANTKLRQVAAMLKAIHVQESREAAQAKAHDVVAKLEAMKLRTNNPMGRLLREAHRTTKMVGAFPDGHSALMLVAARLRHVSTTHWRLRRYMNMKLIEEMAYSAA